MSLCPKPANLKLGNLQSIFSSTSFSKIWLLNILQVAFAVLLVPIPNAQSAEKVRIWKAEDLRNAVEEFMTTIVRPQASAPTTIEELSALPSEAQSEVIMTHAMGSPAQDEHYTDLAKIELDKLFEKMSLKVGKTKCAKIEEVAKELQQFVQPFEGELADLEKICISRLKDYKIEVAGSLTTTPNTRLLERVGQHVPVDVWEHELVPKYQFFHKLKGVSIERDVFIKVDVTDKYVQVDVDGVGVNGFGQDLFGTHSLPDGLLHFGVRGVTISNTGTAQVRASAPILNIPIRYDTTTDEFSHGVVSVLGFIKFQVGHRPGVLSQK